MPSSITIGPSRNPRELGALLDVLAPTFNFTREQGERYTKIAGRKNYRVARRGSTVLGGCALLPLGQFFGGKSVPMIGVAAVGVAPEHRGQRIASALMQAAVRETHQRGVPLSALYPATLPLYRSVGYEQAGVRHEIRIPAKSLQFKGLDRGEHLDMRRYMPRDQKAVEQCYRAKAQFNPGNLDRSDFLWHRVRTPRGQPTQGFIVTNPKTRKVEGYSFYYQKDVPEAPYSLLVTDLVALTPAAGRRLLSFFADHRSMTHEIVFPGTPDDPIIKLLPERTYSAKLLDHWMLRVVNAPKALTMRGYAACVEVEVHLEVADELIAGNNGRFVLEVRKGKARVRRGGGGDIGIDIRGLAALYSGHLAPAQLLVTGQIAWSKSVQDQADALAALFAGPDPWMPDMF